MSDIVFVTSHMNRALGGVSTKGRTHRACLESLPRYSPDYAEEPIEGDWVFFSGTVDESQLEEMIDDLHYEFLQLKADPMLVMAAGQIFYVGIGDKAIGIMVSDLEAEAQQPVEEIPADVLQHVAERELPDNQPKPALYEHGIRLGRLGSPD